MPNLAVWQRHRVFLKRTACIILRTRGEMKNNTSYRNTTLLSKNNAWVSNSPRFFYSSKLKTLTKQVLTSSTTRSKLSSKSRQAGGFSVTALDRLIDTCYTWNIEEHIDFGGGRVPPVEGPPKPHALLGQRTYEPLG